MFAMALREDLSLAISSSLKDPHPARSTCNGKNCSSGSSCDKCALWDEEHQGRFKKVIS